MSRNPLYLGFYLIAFASCLYTPHILNLVLVAIAITVHHRIILAEERFLHQHFGKTYDQYTERVRRYL